MTSTQGMPGSDSFETEWQFDTDDLDRVEKWLTEQPESAALRFALAKDALQNDVYWDTEDWAIHRAGFALRLRRSNDLCEATLKSLEGGRRDGPRVRREINQALPASETDILANEGPVSARVRLLAGKHALTPLFEVVTHRRAFRAGDKGVPVAEVALDEVWFKGRAGDVTEMKRVEVEALGSRAWEPLLQSFVDALAVDLDLRPAAAAKFAMGLAAAGLEPEPALDFGETELTGEEDAGQFALVIMRRFFCALVSHEPGTRLGEDSEQLHQMRVSLRRLRAAVSMFRDVLPRQLNALQDDLRWLGQALGEVRDLDVQLLAFSEMRAAAPWDESNALGELMEVLEASHREARARLLEALDSDRYATLIDALTTALSEDPVPTARIPVREFVAPILEKRYRQFRRDSAPLTPDSEPPAYHAARVRAKRLRYSVEFVRPVYGKSGRRLAEAVVLVQDLLGEHQDAAVAIDWLRNLARERGRSLAPQTLVFMGELMARHRHKMQDLRRQWPDAAKEVRKAWRRLRDEMDQPATNSEDERHGAETPVIQDGAEARVPRWQRGPLALLRRRRQGPYAW